MPKRKQSQNVEPVIKADVLVGLENFGQLCLLFDDSTQERYEVARPLLLNQAVTVNERAQQTQKHPQTIRRYVRRFQQQGMRGLFDQQLAETIPRCGSVSEAVRQEVIRLKMLYPPLHLREIANIIYATLGARIDYKTVQHILQKHPLGVQKKLPLPKFRDYSDPYQARLEVVQLYYRGWNIQSLPKGHPAVFLVSRDNISTIYWNVLRQRCLPG